MKLEKVRRRTFTWSAVLATRLAPYCRMKSLMTAQPGLLVSILCFSLLFFFLLFLNFLVAKNVCHGCLKMKLPWQLPWPRSSMVKKSKYFVDKNNFVQRAADVSSLKSRAEKTDLWSQTLLILGQQLVSWVQFWTNQSEVLPNWQCSRLPPSPPQYTHTHTHTHTTAFTAEILLGN